MSARGGASKIRETLEVVDRTIEGIRRIIARLSPLVLQELGLIAAVRKEAKDLAKSAGVKAKVTVSPEFGRLPAARGSRRFIAWCRKRCITWRSMRMPRR